MCASQEGQLEILIDSLPGFPDGVSLAEDGNFWITLAAPNQAFVKILPYRCDMTHAWPATKTGSPVMTPNSTGVPCLTAAIH